MPALKMDSHFGAQKVANKIKSVLDKYIYIYT